MSHQSYMFSQEEGKVLTDHVALFIAFHKYTPFLVFLLSSFIAIYKLC